MRNVENPTTIGTEFTTVEIGNNTFNFLAVEHDVDSWEANKDVVLAAIEGANTVIVEYFPPEFEQDGFITEYFAQDYREENDLFYKILDPLKHKDVLVIDPACNGQFGVLFRVPGPTISLITAYGLLSGTVKDFNEKGITRRTLIKGFFACTATAALGYIPRVTDVLALENDFRRALIAYNLLRLPANNENPLLIYPKAHIEGILNYVQNPDLLYQRMQVYQQITRLLPEENSQIRGYNWSGGEWKKSRSI